MSGPPAKLRDQALRKPVYDRAGVGTRDESVVGSVGMENAISATDARPGVGANVDDIQAFLQKTTTRWLNWGTFLTSASNDLTHLKSLEFA